MHRISKSATKLVKIFNINKLKFKIMKIYKFESAVSTTTLETTTSKDKDYFMGTYRVTRKTKDGRVWVIKYFDWKEEAKAYFLQLVKEWIL